MNPLQFAGEVILVSASGVLSPGPLFFINIIFGSKQGFTGGIKIAFGHTIVEFPFVRLEQICPPPNGDLHL
jgi:threonine/homoserine/homoserine lactone efflux protein